jgi:glycosyltransferase involved in cell wall biosynthesis
MKLLLYSHFFSPSVGGVETVVLALATGFTNRLSPSGSTRFETTLVAQTPADDARDSLLPFRVVRQPSSSQLRRLIREADVVHFAGVAILPDISALLAGKPVIVEHHGFPTICPTGQLFQEPQSIPCPGHFIRAGDSADLAVQIERILDDPALSKRFASTAHRRVIGVFTEEGMIVGHARICEQLLPVGPA